MVVWDICRYESGLKYIIINRLHTFTGLEFKSYTIFDQTTRFKIFWKGKKFESPSEIPSHDLQNRS